MSKVLINNKFVKQGPIFFDYFNGLFNLNMRKNRLDYEEIKKE